MLFASSSLHGDRRRNRNDTFLRLVLHMDPSKARAAARGPFEVVHHAPVLIARHGDPLVHGAFALFQKVAENRYGDLIIHLAVC